MIGRRKKVFRNLLARDSIGRALQKGAVFLIASNLKPQDKARLSTVCHFFRRVLRGQPIDLYPSPTEGHCNVMYHPPHPPVFDCTYEYDFVDLLKIASYWKLVGLRVLDKIPPTKYNQNLRKLRITTHWHSVQTASNVKSLDIEELWTNAILGSPRWVLFNPESIKTLLLDYYEGFDLEFIKELPSLEDLYLGNCQNIEDLKAVGQAKRLCSLEIDNCQRLSSLAPLLESQTLLHLQIVHLFGLQLSGLRTLLVESATLRTLVISVCFPLDLSSITHCKSLRRMILAEPDYCRPSHSRLLITPEETETFVVEDFVVLRRQSGTCRATPEATPGFLPI